MAHEQHNHTGHNHSHTHATGNIATAFFINTAFAIIELVGGLLTNSVAILSDALHDFGDSLSLGMSWFFQRKSRQGRTRSFTYGYRRFSLLGAIINSVVLIVGCVFIIKESIERIGHPQTANAKGMLLLAILGVVVNGAAMLRLKKGESINEKVVSLHFLEDVLGWVAVLVGAVIMMFTDAPVIDPILSLLIAGFVLFNVYRNMKPAFKIILQAIPDDVSIDDVKKIVMENNTIVDVHDFHLWTMDGMYNVLSMHIVVNKMMDLKEAEHLKEQVKEQLKKENIEHATIEVEYNPKHCEQSSC